MMYALQCYCASACFFVTCNIIFHTLAQLSCGFQKISINQKLTVMKTFFFLLIAIVLPFVGICQSSTEIENEKAAIKAVIEKETNAWINVDYDNWKACYLQEDPFVRINTTPDNFGGANNWASYDSTLNAFYKNYEGPVPLPTKTKNENYLIRVKNDAAWAAYIENSFDNEGNKTGWNVCTRFLEKKDGEWKIGSMTWVNAGLYETSGEKLQMAKMLSHNGIIGGIAFAKSLGMSVEELAKKQGEIWKAAWDKELGFNGLVNFAISSWTTLAGNIEILNQTDNNFVMKVSEIYPELETSGLIGVTYDELMTWYKEVMPPISEYLGCSYSFLIKDDGVEITINKI